MYIAAALAMATLGVRTPECAAGQGLLPGEVVDALQLVSATCDTTQAGHSGASCRFRASVALGVLQQHAGSAKGTAGILRGTASAARRGEVQSSHATTPGMAGAHDIPPLPPLTGYELNMAAVDAVLQMQPRTDRQVALHASLRAINATEDPTTRSLLIFQLNWQLVTLRDEIYYKTSSEYARNIDSLLKTQSRSANVLTESSPQAIPPTDAVPAMQLNGMNPVLTLDTLSLLMSNNTADIDRAIRNMQQAGSLNSTQDVLRMQQMMNAWSFTLGLSSSLTKTIADSLKGVVQKISRGASVLEAASIDDRIAELSALVAEQSALKAAAAAHAAALGSVIGDKAAEARVAEQLPEWAAELQHADAVAEALRVGGQSALELVMAEAMLQDQREREEAAAGEQDLSHNEDDTFRIAQERLVAELQRVASFVESQVQIQRGSIVVGAKQSKVVERNANVLTESSPQAIPPTNTVPAMQLNGMNPVLTLDTLSLLMSNNTADIDRAIRNMQQAGSLNSTQDVLRMQQMMNAWSFTLGLSSSLTKTIADSLKGIVQKISRGASVLEAASIDDRIAELSALVAEQSALKAAAAAHAAALGSAIGDKAAEARVAEQLPEWAVELQHADAVAEALRVGGQSALELVMAEAMLQDQREREEAAAGEQDLSHNEDDTFRIAQERLVAELQRVASFVESQVQIQRASVVVGAKQSKVFDRNANVLTRTVSRNIPVSSPSPRFAFAVLPTACVDVRAELRRIARALHTLL